MAGKPSDPLQSRRRFVLAMFEHRQRGIPGNLLEELAQTVFEEWQGQFRRSTEVGRYGQRSTDTYDSEAARAIISRWLVSRRLCSNESATDEAVDWLVDLMEEFCLEWRTPNRESRIEEILGIAEEKPRNLLVEYITRTSEDAPLRLAMPPLPHSLLSFGLLSREKGESLRKYKKRCRKRFHEWLDAVMKRALKPKSGPRILTRPRKRSSEDRQRPYEELLAKLCYRWTGRKIHREVSKSKLDFDNNAQSNLHTRIERAAERLGMLFPTSRKGPRKLRKHDP